MAESVACDRHPRVLTTLRCGRCDTPICPQCLVHAAVGIRCLDCGRPQRLPTFDVSPGRLAAALAVSVVTGAVSGAIAGAGSAIIYAAALPFASMVHWGAFIFVGYVVGELTSLAANRKRGTPLKITAAVGMLAALVADISLEGAVYRALVLLDGPPGPLLVGSIYGIGAVVVAFYIAVRRF